MTMMVAITYSDVDEDDDAIYHDDIDDDVCYDVTVPAVGKLRCTMPIFDHHISIY